MEHLNAYLISHGLCDFAIRVFGSSTAMLDALYAAFGADVTALRHTPVVFMMMNKFTGQVAAEQLVYAPSILEPWSLPLPVCTRCASGALKPAAGVTDRLLKKDADYLQFVCEVCSSPWKIVRPAGIFGLPFKSHNFFFIVPFPPPILQLDPH